MKRRGLQKISIHLCALRRLHSRKMKIPFEIPAPIERSSTDLLQALAETVKQNDDSPLPHASIIDDPFTIPTTFRQRKEYLLCKEYGLRTARKLVEEWPTLFMLDRDKPQLGTFRPQKPLDPSNVEATEEKLVQMLTSKYVSDAIKLFGRMEEEGTEISSETMLAFFRLLCYYNAEDIPISEHPEWHARRIYYSNNDQQQLQAWKGKENEPSLAERFFEKLPKTDETYSLLICALCKYPNNYSIGKARELYKKMISEGHVPFEEVFNYMIAREIPLDDDTQIFNPLLWLKEMVNNFKISPSVHTFNILFKGISQSNDKLKDSRSEIDGNEEYRLKREYALILLSEMNKLGIEQSLTIYRILLELLPTPGDIQSQVDLLVTIFHRLEAILEKEEEIKFTDAEDQRFFFSAMRIAANSQNESLLDRLMNIYEHRKNLVKIQEQMDEQRFYDNYIVPKLYLLPLDQFLVLYKQFVPQLLSLSRFLFVTIFNEMKRRKPDQFHWPLLKRIVEDGVSAQDITIDSLALVMMQHLKDVNPRMHLSKPDANEYMALCDRFIEKIEQYDIMVENFSAFHERRREEEREQQKAKK